MNSSKQIKLGAIFSYLTIAFNMIAGLIYTPWMLEKIGKENYGLYTLTTSLITMFVMDFGMGAAVAKFISKYNAEEDQESINNFLGLIYKLYFFIDAIILIALIIIYFSIDFIYINLSYEELEKFKTLYIIVALFSIISFPFTNLNGILTSYEKFIQLKVCDLFNKVLIIILMILFLLMGYGVYSLVLVNAIVGLLTIFLKLLIIKKQTEVRVNFKFFDKSILKEIFGFSVWTTVGSIMQRLIFNITPSIIASVSLTGTMGVAIFGLAGTIEGYIYTFATAINGMFMPRISKIITNGKKEEELLSLMIKVGRIQTMIIGIFTTGFIVLGKSFIVNIWHKPDFLLSYYCAVILIIPSFFYLPMQIGNTTLVVENKVKLQAYVFIIMGVVNFFCSLVLTKYFGAIGASVSIFIAYMIRTILMGIIYHKILKLNMILFIKETFFKLLPYFFIVLIIGLICEDFNPVKNIYLHFFMNGIIIVGIYFILMWLFGFNEYEKNIFKKLK